MTLCTNKPNPDVFFLGAGASVSGGAPTFTNFRDKAKDVLYMLQGGNHDSKKISLFQNVLTQWNENFSDYNIEEYYSAVELSEQLDGDDKSITTEEIAIFIALTIQKLIVKSNTPSYKLLANYGVAKAIITTNWDILLEHSVEESMFHYGALIQSYKKPPLQSSGGYIIPILKLHGSLNWGFCEECGQIYYFDEKIYGQLVSANNVKCEKHPDVRLTPFIIPPTLSKLEKAEIRNRNSPYVPLRSVWSEARKYLMSCDEVYFIGYSFPETDVQMKIFISDALRQNEKLEKITIVSNPKYGKSRVDFEERYSPILSKTKNVPEVIFEYSGFEKFCEKLSLSERSRRHVVKA